MTPVFELMQGIAMVIVCFVVYVHITDKDGHNR